MPPRSLALILTAVVLLGSRTAGGESVGWIAAGWPHPAAGESASGAPEVLFTFDDGPHEEYTPKILDALAKHHIHAVFFWTGRRVGPNKLDDERRAVFARAIAEGHLVGNHTVHHAHLCLVKKADAEREIDDNAKILGALAGMPITWMRVPYGDRCKRLEKQLAERGLIHMHWDMDPMEWKNPSTDHVKEYLENQLRFLKGRAVILVHDTHPSGAEAIPKVLDWIDQENARRRKRHQPEIRILSFADVERERLPAGLDALVDETFAAATSFPADLVGDLILPLAPRPPRTAGL